MSFFVNERFQQTFRFVNASEFYGNRNEVFDEFISFVFLQIRHRMKNSKFPFWVTSPASTHLFRIRIQIFMPIYSLCLWSSLLFANDSNSLTHTHSYQYIHKSISLSWFTNDKTCLQFFPVILKLNASELLEDIEDMFYSVLYA